MLMYGGRGPRHRRALQRLGRHGFVLTYRLSPRYGENARVLDGTRAIQLVRANAAAWKLDPARIGYIGFSAGSNMGTFRRRGGSRRVMRTPPTRSTASARDPIIWRSSMVPDERRRANRSRTFRRPFSSRPPAIRGRRLANAQLFMDLTRAGAVAEMHVYQKGRHGFGSGFGSPAFGGWMAALQRFLASRRLPADATLSMERLAFPICGVGDARRRPCRHGADVQGRVTTVTATTSTFPLARSRWETHPATARRASARCMSSSSTPSTSPRSR